MLLFLVENVNIKAIFGHFRFLDPFLKTKFNGGWMGLTINLSDQKNLHLLKVYSLILMFVLCIEKVSYPKMENKINPFKQKPEQTKITLILFCVNIC